MNPVYRFCLFALLLVTGIPCAFSQLTNPDLKGTIGKAETDSVPPGIMPLDTAVPVKYVLIGNEKRIYTEEDSVTWKTFNGDPLVFGLAHLGNLGSAYRSLELNSDQPIGFSTGWLQFENYFPHEETFKYFVQQTPVAKIRYDQAGREDTHIALEFGKRFENGTS